MGAWMASPVEEIASAAHAWGGEGVLCRRVGGRWGGASLGGGGGDENNLWFEVCLRFFPSTLRVDCPTRNRMATLSLL